MGTGCVIWCLLGVFASCHGSGGDVAADPAAASAKLQSGGPVREEMVVRTVVLSANETTSGPRKEKTTYDETNNHMEMFENFQLVHEVYVNETKLPQKLEGLRELLAKVKHVEAVTPELLSKVREAREVVRNLTREYPTAKDLTGARRGLLILQDTYQFDLPSLAKGKLVSKEYPTGPLSMRNDHRLRLDDFVALTSQAFSVKWYDRAIDFLRQAFKVAGKMTEEEKAAFPDDFDKTAARMEKMRRDLFQLNNHHLYSAKASVTAEWKVHRYIVTEKLARRKDQPEFILRGQFMGMENKTKMGKDAYFRATCGGWSMKMDPLNRRCRLLHHGDPYMRLSPFKLEVISEDPYVYVFPDFYHQSEMDYMIEYAKPRLSRRREFDPYNEAVKNGTLEDLAKDYNITFVEKEEEEKTKKKPKTKVIHKSVQAWLRDVAYHKFYDNLHELEENNTYTILHPLMYKLSRRLELVTGFNFTGKYACSDYQMTNYGLGGLCEIHTDPSGYVEGVLIPPTPDHQRALKYGDIVATTMGWLEDVEAGGATAFCQPYEETLVFPSKGAVGFWYGLDMKGHRDLRLLHGGCPVIKGSKWIMNKWAYFYDQWANYPCSVDPGKRFGGFHKTY